MARRARRLARRVAARARRLLERRVALAARRAAPAAFRIVLPELHPPTIPTFYFLRHKHKSPLLCMSLALVPEALRLLRLQLRIRGSALRKPGGAALPRLARAASGRSSQLGVQCHACGRVAARTNGSSNGSSNGSTNACTASGIVTTHRGARHASAREP